MSLGTIFSFIAAIIVVLGSILSATDNPGVFVDVPSLIIVVGGTFVALFISYETKTAISALKLMGTTFLKHTDSDISLKDEIGRIVRWAYIIQKNGLQGLENEITDELRKRDAFVAYGTDLVITGYTGQEINQILDQMLEAETDRNKTALDALKKMGGDAPAFGIPLATKISARYDRSLFKNTMLKEGLVLLAERKSPRYIQDKINSFVDIKDQFLIDRDLNNTPTSQSEN